MKRPLLERLHQYLGPPPKCPGYTEAWDVDRERFVCGHCAETEAEHLLREAYTQLLEEGPMMNRKTTKRQVKND